MGLAASQDLALIALFLQLITVGTYILVGINKQNRLGTEAAVKMFLYAPPSALS
jgi:NADH:ubiquinone oxidoreductase subunit 2 (subunit N)